VLDDGDLGERPGWFRGTARFRPTGFIGQGSMGLVYRAIDEETGIEVALKTIPALAPEQIYDLKQEFRSLAGIRHRNLVELYELFVDERQCFFTMEYVPGSDLLSHVREGSRLDLDRLLGTAIQLAAGIAHLHAARKVHRDIKPSNALVDPSGRVVILDFGLSIPLLPDQPRASMAVQVGTPAYMSPEQTWGRPPAAASDWYSVGALLYEVATGRLPFTAGTSTELLMMKERQRPQPPCALVPDLPRELSRLIDSLLAADPQSRPAATEILSVLESLSAHHGVAGAESVARRAPLGQRRFVGRSSDLATLRRGLVASRAPSDGGVIHVEGASGMGKSELVGEFLSDMRQSGGLALRSRCHPQESVPYKALDGAIDDLSRHLLSLADAEARTLVPPLVGALVRVFPVLARVPALAEPDGEPAPPEAFELRRRAIGALRELLTRVAVRAPLVLWIDDFHWGDADSALFLAELTRPTVPPGLLLVLSFRSEERARVDALIRDSGALDGPIANASEKIRLGPLTRTDARDLARAHCEQLGGSPSEAVIDAITTEAAGSPFFVGELARVTAGPATGDAGGATTVVLPRLAAVFDERLRDIDEASRRVLEIVAVAGWPLVRSAALTAADLGEAGRPLLWSLEDASLLRATSIGDQPALEVYHDRIREFVVERLASTTRTVRHRSIADALAALPTPDPQALFEHYLGAGERDLARPHAVAAAEIAASALAFARAAGLYRQAIGLGLEGRERAEALSRLGDVLQAGGRGIEAAESFERAAGELRELGEVRERVLTLRRRASEQYVRSGAIDRGKKMLAEFLGEVGIRIPRTPRRALASSVLQRARLMWRGTEVAARGAGPPTVDDRLRLEALWSAAASLTMVDPMLADAMTVRGLLTALELGDASHTIRGLGLEAAREAALGGPLFAPRSKRLVAALERIAHSSDDPYDLGWVHQSVGGTAYLSGRWKEASEECGKAVSLWRSRCIGAAWEIVTAESFELSALAYMGELTTLARRLPDAISDADQRDDVYAASGFRMGILSLHWLARDDVAGARAEADTSIARWPRDRFLLQHFLHLVGSVHVDLYADDGWRAWRRINEAWPALRRAQLLAIGSARVELLHLRSRAALAAATQVPGAAAADRVAPDPAWPRARLLRVVARDARRLAREKLPPAAGFAALLEAALAVQSGDRAAADRHLAHAADAAEAADMRLYSAAAAACRDGRSPAASGEPSPREAREWMAAQGVGRPDAFTRMLAPGVAGY